MQFLETLIQQLFQQLTAGKLFQITLLVVSAWLAVRVVRWLLETVGQRFARYRLQVTRLFPFLRLLLWVVVMCIVFFGILALPENTVLAALAALGVTVGLAAQDLLRSLFAGVLMIFNAPFQLGDMVRIGDHYGGVIGIDLNLTRLRTFTDDVVTIPNAEIFRQAIANSNAGELTEMIAVNIHVPVTVDVQAVISQARKAAISSPFTYLKKPVLVTVEEHLAYRPWIRLTVKAYVIDVRLERQMASDVYARLRATLGRSASLVGPDSTT